MNCGEIWDINFSSQIGDEVRRVRPAVIVNHDAMGVLKLKVVVPVTNAMRTTREWHVSLSPTDQNGLTKESVADCFQIKSLSRERFIKKRGRLSQQEMDDIKLGIMKVLDLL